MHNQKTDQEKFPYVEQPKLMKDKKSLESKKTAKGATTFTSYGAGQAKDEGQSKLENPRLFIYVIGGLSHHEICSVACL